MTGRTWMGRSGYRASRRRFLGGAVSSGAGLAGMTLVGCGDDDDAPPTSGAPAGSPTAGSSNGASQPKQGGTLRLTTAGDPPTIYPFENITTAVQRPAAHHYSRLLRSATGPDIKDTEFTKIEGDLAASIPEQPDELSYVFTLKPNIFFHDKEPLNGRQATAHDFVDTWTFFSAQAINASRFNQVIERLEAPDDQTIRITMKEPNAPFLVVGAASDQGLWFIPVETINNDQAKSDPVGTGPWKYKAWEQGVRMSWERHDKWFDAPAPYIENLEQAFVTDAQRILIALEGGEIDQAAVPTNNLPEIEAIQPPGQVSITPNSSIYTVMFNFDNTPWHDKRVRQALSMAMDRDGYLDVLDDTGTNTWNSFFGPALVPYFLDPKSEDFGTNAKYFEYNPAEVRALLSAATGSESLDVNLVSNVDRYGASARQAWEVLASNVRESGFNAQNVYQEYGAYIQSSYFGKLPDPIAVTLGPLFGLVLDPDDIFMSCFWSGSSRHNWSGTPIDEMAKLDEMYLEQRRLLDLEERTEYVHEIQREMAESMLVIPAVNAPTVNYIHSWVKDAWYKATYAQVMETFSHAYFTDERLARG